MANNRKILLVDKDVLLNNDFLLKCPEVGPKEWCRLNPKKVVDHSFLITTAPKIRNFISYYERLSEAEQKLHRYYEVSSSEGEEIEDLLKEISKQEIFGQTQVLDDPMYTLLADEPWHNYQYFLKKMEIPNMRDGGATTLMPASTLRAKGKQPIVAIIDTGINFNNAELAKQYEPVPQNGGEYKYPGYNAIVRNFQDHEDQDGHGTFIAGLLSSIKNETKGHGVAYQFRVLNIKAFSKGKSSTASICNSIFFAIKNGASIINCSWGPPFHRKEDDDEVLKDFIDFAYQEKAICVCAAGNQGNNVKGYYPASSEKVITVSASNRNDILMEFSNFGLGIDIVAPGESILSLDQNAEGTIKSGTSFAAALISGCIVMILGFFPRLKYSPDHENPAIYFEAIKKLLQDSAVTKIKSYEELNEAAKLLNVTKLLAEARKKSDRLMPIIPKP